MKDRIPQMTEAVDDVVTHCDALRAAVERLEHPDDFKDDILPALKGAGQGDGRRQGDGRGGCHQRAAALVAHGWAVVDSGGVTMPDIPDSPLTAVEAAALRELYLRALAAGLMPTEEWPVGLSTGLVKIGRIAGRAKPGPAGEVPIGLLRLAGQPDGTRAGGCRE